ncbi:MAG: DNA adenine methylase [Thermoplasmataceae archaeon]
MVYLRLLKYPGAKFVVIPDIRKVFNNSHCNMFIDVFGGSGSVSLNVNSPTTVYNDIDLQFTNLFNSIKYKPEILYEMLKDEVASGDETSKFRTASNNVSDTSTGERGEVRKTGKAGAGSGWSPDLSEPASGNSSIIDPLGARDTIVRFSRSFGGLGDTYGTQREKSSNLYLKKTLYSFGKIHDVVGKWQIENLDFRVVLRKYDSEGAFFYFDPPYPGKNWYNYNFTESDFLELADFLKRAKGKYLLTLDADDKSLSRIFGKPSLIRKYANQNGPTLNRRDKIRSRAFYTNVFL